MSDDNISQVDIEVSQDAPDAPDVPVADTSDALDTLFDTDEGEETQSVVDLKEKGVIKADTDRDALRVEQLELGEAIKEIEGHLASLKKEYGEISVQLHACTPKLSLAELNRRSQKQRAEINAREAKGKAEDLALAYKALQDDIE